jgi:hypothetical protein
MSVGDFTVVEMCIWYLIMVISDLTVLEICILIFDHVKSENLLP